MVSQNIIAIFLICILQLTINETQHEAAVVQSHAWLYLIVPIVKWRTAESNPRVPSGFAKWLEMQSLRVGDAPTGTVHHAPLVPPCEVGCHIQGIHIGSSQQDIVHSA